MCYISPTSKEKEKNLLLVSHSSPSPSAISLHPLILILASHLFMNAPIFFFFLPPIPPKLFLSWSTICKIQWSVLDSYFTWLISSIRQNWPLLLHKICSLLDIWDIKFSSHLTGSSFSVSFADFQIFLTAKCCRAQAKCFSSLFTFSLRWL